MSGGVQRRQDRQLKRLQRRTRSGAERGLEEAGPENTRKNDNGNQRPTGGRGCCGKTMPEPSHPSSSGGRLRPSQVGNQHLTLWPLPSTLPHSEGRNLGLRKSRIVWGFGVGAK